MALYDPENEGGHLPPPQAPTTSGSGAPAAPAPGGYVSSSPVGAPEKLGGGGGNGGGGWALPALPNFSAPGAPVFNAPHFAAPTLQQVQNSPGYQFRLQSGQQSLQGAAAAKGLLRSGGTLADLTKYGTELADQQYQNDYGNALQAFDRDYKSAYDAFAPSYDRWKMQASTGLQGQLQRYGTDLSHSLQMGAPRPEQAPDYSDRNAVLRSILGDDDDEGGY